MTCGGIPAGGRKTCVPLIFWRLHSLTSPYLMFSKRGSTWGNSEDVADIHGHSEAGSDHATKPPWDLVLLEEWGRLFPILKPFSWKTGHPPPFPATLWILPKCANSSVDQGAIEQLFQSRRVNLVLKYTQTRTHNGPHVITDRRGASIGGMRWVLQPECK